MKVFDLLQLQEPSLKPQNCKIHFARYNQHEHPLDVFIEGQFDGWQSWQGSRNFKREFVLSFVQAGTTTSWLFVGLFRVKGCVLKKEPEQHFMYDLERVQSCEEFVGRLYATSPYTQRNSYLLGETLAPGLVVSHILPRRLSIADFPGYKLVDVPKGQLDIIVRDSIPTWRTALSNVKGIYLISDRKTHKLYVGKADGVEGIWGRWCVYAKNGHGGNVALREELGIDSLKRQADLRFSLLEIADIHSTKEEILAREEHWKTVLMTRNNGYNRN
ncbi:GIY-YIG nuclease family protein [Bordetella hinzii]|uniref:GIY-YIG nuclease family protein n=1 Tax=Bordetella hinzii TaxID=103855 RepID=UPI0005BDAF96|nr:GIY-YIG nuclease family protein [Bordetella hinzii]